MKKIMSVVLALVLVSALSVSVFAAGSVVAPVVKDYDGGTVTIAQDTTGNATAGKEFTFSVETKDGYNFLGWEIDGNYEIVSGSLESETVTVRFLDDISIEDIGAEPIFEAIDDADEPTDDDDEPTTTAEKEETSPKTGDSMAMVALAAVALAGVVVSKKKLSK